jgi:hypothetical protein
MAHETAIHRVDVELAHADVTPIEEDLALDGVDEVLRRFLAGDWSDEPAPERPGDIVEVRSGGTTWRVVMEPKAIVANVYLDWGPELPAAATVSGDPLPMYLWLWGRGPSDSLTVDGEAATVDHLRARLVTATQ